MRVPKKFLPSILVLVLLSRASHTLAQGLGNGRDLALRTSVQAGSLDDAAKLIRPLDEVSIELATPLGTLAGAPVLIAADLRSRAQAANVLQFPGEPGACGLGAGLHFIVDGSGQFPALVPGLHALGAAAQVFPMTLPAFASTSQVSVWVQGATVDAGAPNGIAFTKAVRHDTNLLATRSAIAGESANALAGQGLAVADVNRDGFGDVLVGCPGASPLGVSGAGEVQVYEGPSLASALVLRAPALQPGAWFGNVVRAGDVNGDGDPDLLVGARFEDVNGLADAGAAYVYFGPTFAQCVRLVAPVPEAGARFGHMVATTDWTGDGIQDLVVSAPKASSGGFAQAGRVYLFRGPSLALERIFENPTPMFGSKFGYGLAGADFDGDGTGDLAIGIPFHDECVDDDTGRAVILRGPNAETLATIVQPLDQDAVLGHVLATADFDGDGWVDLALGAEFDDESGVVDSGAVHLAYGPAFTTCRILVSPASVAGGGFGSDVASADLNHDGHPDLVVGAFYNPTAGLVQAGCSVALLGPSFEQHVLLEPADPQSGAQAGRRVAAGDIDGDGFAEALMSSVLATPAGITSIHAGEVSVFR